MYLVSLHGQTTSSSPGSSGAPTEWTAGTHSVFGPIWASAAAPIRVMIPVLITT